MTEISTEISTVSTHVLDTTLGRPASGITVVLETIGQDGTTTETGRGVTDADGRIARLNSGPLAAGDHRLVFLTGGYLADTHGTALYPRITVEARLAAGRSHVHLPLLLNPFSYSTYLGS